MATIYTETTECKYMHSNVTQLIEIDIGRLADYRIINIHKVIVLLFISITFSNMSQNNAPPEIVRQLDDISSYHYKHNGT